MANYLTKYHFISQQVIETQSALYTDYPNAKVVRAENPQGDKDTVVFTIDGMEVERWKLRKASWLMDKIREWIG